MAASGQPGRRGSLYNVALGWQFRASGLDVANQIRLAMRDAAEAKAVEMGVDLRLTRSDVDSDPSNFGGQS